MDKKNKKYFKELLIKMKRDKQDLLEKYEERINNADDKADTSTHPFHSADIGTDMAMLERDSVDLNEIVDEIRLIEEALDKIANGSFGICEMCDKDISIKRLKAIPHARMCIECKAKK